MALAPTYASRRVLVTGDTGFKGGWLSAWLVRLGAEVTGFSTPAPTQPSLFEAARIARVVRHVDGDVRDAGDVAAVISEARPEIVFHLAAQSLVRRSYLQPLETFATNVMGTANLLEAVRAAESVRAVVIVSSDKSYANAEAGVPFRETDPMGGHDPYSASKGAAEIVAASFRDSFFGDGALVATARAGNVIGGGDWADDRIIPDAVRALTSDRPVMVRNPASIRPWQHVLSPLSGYLVLGAALLDGDRDKASAWNFGPTDDTADRTVRWVVERFLAAWGEGQWAQASGSDAQPHEAGHLALDSGKARRELQWLPVWDAERAVTETADWYREYYRAPARARALMEDQLVGFERDAHAAGVPWARELQEING
jgi:CDP-glucose 4,6-dehydratase